MSYTGDWTGSELFNYPGATLADDSNFILGANPWLFNNNTGGSNFSGDQVGAANFVTP